jgi:hypothetical protein
MVSGDEREEKDDEEEEDSFSDKNMRSDLFGHLRYVREDYIMKSNLKH